MPPADHVTARTALSIAGHRVELTISVPRGNTTAKSLLPILRPLTDRIVDIAIERSLAEGRPISCKAGCGACCRQLVPISGTEAVRLSELVDELPEPRRTEIRARFAAAHEKLAQAGLVERLDAAPGQGKEALRSLGLDYFAVGVPCPFLEDESCSIYDERPHACREYLVTSPAEHCARPARDTVECVKMPGNPSVGLGWADTDPAAKTMRWVPLIRSLDWAPRHAHELPRRPGPDLVKTAFSRLTGDAID